MINLNVKTRHTNALALSITEESLVVVLAFNLSVAVARIGLDSRHIWR
jgi:hypothetical protein